MSTCWAASSTEFLVSFSVIVLVENSNSLMCYTSLGVFAAWREDPGPLVS
jgi:hypothetical protein